MFFSNHEMMLLRLIGRCKSLPCDVLVRYPGVYMTSECCLDGLIKRKLLYLSSQDSTLRLTTLGFGAAERLGFAPGRDKYATSDRSELARRNQSAEILFTTFAAGFDVFAETGEALRAPSTYLPSFALRRSVDGHCLSGTRLNGLANGHDRAFVFYHVGRITDGIRPAHELEIARKLVSCTGGKPILIIYAGNDYLGLAKAVTTQEEQQRYTNGLVTYRDAYEQFPVPVCLMPCDADGAVQLRVMCEPDYRVRLMRAVFGSEYRLPPRELSCCDTMMPDGTAAVLGLDMDARRIREANTQAQQHTGKPVAVFVRKCQVKPVWQLLAGYPIPLYSIKDEVLLDTFSWRELLAIPPLDGYRTPEGQFVDEEAIHRYADAHRVARKKR